MPGSSRDVELVIRARDEATKAITSVSEALKVLSGAQADIGASATKTNGLLGQLGEALGGLQREAQGLQALGVAAKQIDRAGEAVVKMEQAATTAGETLDKLKARQAELATSGSHLAESLGKAKTELEAQKAALAGLTQTQTASKDAVQAQRNVVDGLRTAISGLTRQVTANGAEQQRTANQVVAASESYVRSQENLSLVRTELAGMTAQASTVSQALGGVAVSQTEVGTAAKATAAALAEVADALKRQKSAAGTPASPSGPAAAATEAYRAQIQAVKESKFAWEQASAEAQNLGQAVAKTVVPTREMQAAFLLAKVAAQEAEQAYLANAAGLNRLKGVTQGGFGEFSRMAAALDAGSYAARGAARSLKDLPEIAPQIKPLTQSIRELLAALFQIPTAAGEASAKTRMFGESSRESLSLIQRLRGEILGLAAAYVGLYGAIHQIGEVITTVASVEAAQARLAVVFEGNNQAAADEVKWLMAQAERLGVPFNELSTEYSKVAIAAKEMGFQTESARRIFISLAEAGRVNGLTAEQMNLVFLALSHSIDRGTINARNFNNSIAIQLPGSMKALSEVLDVSIAKLNAMQRATGGVASSEQILLTFADAMRQKYAGELPAALDTTNARLGRFKVFLQEAQLAIGAGGFTKGFKEALDALGDTLNSASGAKTLHEIGQALGQLAQAIPFVIRNFDSLVKVAQLFVAVKVASFVLGLAGANGKLSVSLKAAAVDVARLEGALAGMRVQTFTAMWAQFRAQVSATGAAMATMGADGVIAAAGVTVASAAMTGLRAVMIGLTAVARTMWVAIGGFPGLLITGLTFVLSGLLGDWVSGVNTATSAIDAHDQLLTRITEQYHKATEAADEYAKKALKASAVDLLKDELELRKQLREIIHQGPAGESTVIANLIGGSAASQRRIAELVEQFHAGTLSAKDFSTALGNLALADPKLNITVLKQMKDVADQAAQMEDRIAADTAAMAVIRGTATEAQKALLGLTDAARSLNGALNPTNLQQYNDALQAMAALDPVEKPGVKLRTNIESAQTQLRGALSNAGLSQAQVDQVYHTGRGNPLPGGLNPDTIERVNAALKQYWQTVDDLNTAERHRLDAALPADNVENIRQRIWNHENGRTNPGSARNPRSSASGFGQFTNRTWLGAFDAAEPGLAALTDQAKLALRANEQVAKAVSEYLIRENAGSLARAGVDVSATNQYLAWFLGSANAIKLIQTAMRDPGVRAAALDPAAARSNPEVFYNRGRDGRPNLNSPRSAGDLRQWAFEAMGGGSAILANGKTKQEEFNAQLQLFIEGLTADSTAIAESARAAFVNAKVQEQKRKAEEAGVVFSGPQEAAVRAAAGGDFDAHANTDTQKLIDELDIELAAQVRSHHDLTEAQRAQLRQTYIETEASKTHTDITTELGRAYAERLGQIFDRQQGQEGFNSVVGLGQQRREVAAQIQQAYREGDTNKVAELQTEIADITTRIQESLPAARAFAQAMGDEKMLATLDKVAVDLGRVKTTLITTQEVNQDLARGLTGVFHDATDAVAKFAAGGGKLKDVFAAAGLSFLKFAADFLSKITEMILQQQILNALAKSPLGGQISGLTNSAGGGGGGGLGGLLGSLFGGGAAGGLGAAGEVAGAAAGSSAAGVFSSFFGEMAGLFHGGGIAGQPAPTRSVFPGLFANARRMHGGGVVGLGHDEVATILKKREAVLTEDDPWHPMNRGKTLAGRGTPAPTGGVKILNLFDHGEVLSEALNTAAGEKALINHVQKNRRAFQAALSTG